MTQELSVVQHFEKNAAFCVLPWVHLCASVDGVWGRCCVDRSMYHTHYYTASTQPDLVLQEDSVGCSHNSPFAERNPERVFALSNAFNSPALKNTRLSMLRREKVPACSYCHDREARGGVSYRQNMNGLFRDQQDWDALLSGTAADGRVDRKPVYLDLRLGNRCNLRCIMCCYPVSSNWRRNLEATWLNKTLDPYAEDLEFWNQIREILPGLTRLYFAGGEPMLQPSHRRIINLLIETGAAPSVDLVYNTNLTVLPQDILQAFSHFRSVEIGASCDGIGAVYERIRSGANWPTFVRNLRRVAQCAKVRIAVTPQRDNVSNLPELIEWALANGYELDLTNILQYPEELSISNLSTADRRDYAIQYGELADRHRELGHLRLADELQAIMRTMNTQSP